MQNKKQYAENWADTIRPAILKRDNYKCAHCGVRHRSFITWITDIMWKYIDRDELQEFKDEGKRAYQVHLQVAHRDNDKSNNADSNLITLCQPCHHLMDKTWKTVLRIGKLCKPGKSQGPS